MSDERVERVARALYAHDEHANWDDVANDAASGDRLAGETYEYYIAQARAVLAALDEEPTLEDVLGSDQRFAVMYVGIVQQGDDDWVALVDDAHTKGRVEGVGSTIDAAIRDAVANAKEHG